MSKKELSLQLLCQLIDRAQQEDNKLKSVLISQNKATQAQGDGFMLYHLKALRELIASIEEK
jgi:hypothetical protein|tara:strand:- start:5991 stop:6176 length:186 start_codon:yes stop_codon:yes gene_type:complete